MGKQSKWSRSLERERIQGESTWSSSKRSEESQRRKYLTKWMKIWHSWLRFGKKIKDGERKKNMDTAPSYSSSRPGDLSLTKQYQLVSNSRYPSKIGDTQTQF